MMIAKKETARRKSWKGNDDLHVNKHVYRQLLYYPAQSDQCSNTNIK